MFPRLAERKQNLGRQLSGGEQEMLSIGRALLLNPRLLILDEPSQGLAPLIVKEVFRIVAQMRTEGISVLLVEQNVRMSLEISDHAYVLENGQMVYSGPAAELRADETRIQALAGASAEEWKLEDCCRYDATLLSLFMPGHSELSGLSSHARKPFCHHDPSPLPSMRLDGRRALVTGAGRGIGLAAAAAWPRSAPTSPWLLGP